MKSMQVTYLEQNFSLPLPNTYEECRASIAEKAGIDGRVAWGFQYHDDQQFCDVDNEADYGYMLEGYADEQGPLRINVKVHPNSCSVSEIKPKEDHVLDFDIEVSHKSTQNEQEIKHSNSEIIKRGRGEESQGSEGDEEEEKEAGGLSESDGEQAEQSEKKQESQGQIQIEENGSILDESVSKDDKQSDKQDEKESNGGEEDNQESKESSFEIEDGKLSNQMHQDNQSDEDEKQNSEERESNSNEEKQSNEDRQDDGERVNSHEIKQSRDRTFQMNESTQANVQRQEKAIEITVAKDEPLPHKEHPQIQQISTKIAQQKAPGQNQLSEDQPQSDLEVDDPEVDDVGSNQNQAQVDEQAIIVEETIEPVPIQQKFHVQTHIILQYPPIERPASIERVGSSHEQSLQRISEPVLVPPKIRECQLVRPVHVGHKPIQRTQLGCSFCRKQSPYMQFLCGFHDIRTCEECEENWTIASRKKRVGSNTRPAAPWRSGLKPCSFCGEADGLSKLNAFDIRACETCSWKWEFVPVRRHVWEQGGEC